MSVARLLLVAMAIAIATPAPASIAAKEVVWIPK